MNTKIGSTGDFSCQRKKMVMTGSAFSVCIKSRVDCKCLILKRVSKPPKEAVWGSLCSKVKFSSHHKLFVRPFHDVPLS